jgi:uncharacterized protein
MSALRRPLPRFGLIAVVIAVVLSTVSSPVNAGPGEPAYPGVHRSETVITDREGDELKAYLSFPADADGQRVDGTFPVILHYTYFPAVTWEELTAPIVQQAWTVLGFNLTEGFDDFVRRGYVVAHVALPGTGGGQGHFTFDKGRIGRSGYDVVEWLGTQQWSTGKVGMFGGSGNGIAQLMTAAEQPPHLATIIPAVAYQDLYRDTLYRGGMPALGEAALIAGLGAGIWAWQGNVVPNDPEELQYLLETAIKRVVEGGTPPLFLAEWYTHPTKDPYWDNYTYDVDRITVPVWAWGNWDDHFLLGSVRTYQNVATPDRMLAIGYNGHSAGPGFDAIAEATRWYDYWLKGDHANGIGEELRDAPVRYYLKGANTWRTATNWPPADVSTQRQYAAGGRSVAAATGTLTPEAPTGSLGADSYVYTPISSRLGGENGFLNQGVFGLLPRSPNTDENNTLLAYNNPTGQIDQRLNALDSVTYVGPVLGQDVEVTGEPVVTLNATTTSPDTDWVVRLIDVHPDDSTVPQPGYWNLVDTGWLKGTHRDGHEQPTAIPVGRPVEYEVDLWPTSYQFKAGHRIGIQIASADPRALPNLTLSVNTVHRGQTRPTSIELPVRQG